MWTTRHGALIGPGATVVQVDDTADGARREPAGRPRRARRRRPRPPATSPAAVRGGHRLPLAARCATRIAAEGRWSDAARARSNRDGRPHRPAGAVRRAGRPAARPSARWPSTPATSWATPAATWPCPTSRLLLHPGVPVHRPRPGHRDRRRAGPPGPAAGRRARRRRVHDGHRRAGDRGPAGHRDAGRGLQRRAATAPSSTTSPAATTPPSASRTPTWPRSPPGYGCASATVRCAARPRPRSRTGWPGPRDRPMVVDAKVRADEPSWWLAEAFRGTGDPLRPERTGDARSELTSRTWPAPAAAEREPQSRNRCRDADRHVVHPGEPALEKPSMPASRGRSTDRRRHSTGSRRRSPSQRRCSAIRRHASARAVRSRSR